jgi:hypothetical protein
MTNKCDQAFHRILSAPSAPGVGEDANALLSCFIHGYPLTQLGILLQSQDVSVVEVGAFIASELGSRSRPFLPQIDCLLDTDSETVRASCVLAVATSAVHPSDAYAIAHALRFLTDTSAIVRRCVVKMLCTLTDGQVAAVRSYLFQAGKEPAHIRGMELLANERDLDDADLGKLYAASDVVVQEYLIAIAAKRESISVLSAFISGPTDPKTRDIVNSWIDYLREKENRRHERERFFREFGQAGARQGPEKGP